MKTPIAPTRLGAALAAAGAMLIAAALTATPAGAQEEEQEEGRRIVKKIRIECDGDDCEKSEHGHHPRRFMFRTHAGGGFLGVLLADLTPELRVHFGVAENAGVMVSKVVDDSPAARAGLEVGDIITALDGDRIGSSGELARSIRGKEDDASVLLEVWRDGAVRNLTATVEQREGDAHGMEYAYVLKCDDDESDCSFARRHMKHMKMGSGWDVDFDCEGADPCQVEVKCGDEGDCNCTVNGEETDCSELPGFEE